MKNYFVLFILIFIGFDSLFSQVSIKDQGIISSQLINSFYLVDVDLKSLQEKMSSPGFSASPDNKLEMELPLPSGIRENFVMEEASLMESELAAKYPEIKNYRGYCLDRPEVLIRLNISPRGLYYHISDPNQGDAILSPHWKNSKVEHKLYWQADTYSSWECSIDEKMDDLTDHGDQSFSSFNTNNCFTNGTTFRTFRIAIATTGEFYVLNGGTMASALAALTNRLASVAVPYERDLAITFVIIAGNSTIMYTNAATDPFTNPTNTSTSITQTETAIEGAILDSDYDIGHGYHEITCGGGCGWAGLAGVAVVCRNGSKARAYTYQPNDIAGNNTVWMHEIGHQFGCLHTIYGCSNTGCQRYEPGQGHTIMSTSAGCTAADDYTNRVDFFNAGALDQAIGFVTSGLADNGSCTKITVTGGGTCAATSTTANTAIPIANADPTTIIATIPIGTPFELTGSATDANGDALTYSWEHYDTDGTNTDVPDNTGGIATAPLFRVFSPSSSVTRVFPQLSSILSGSTAGTGEVLPTVGRSMNMRFIVRDNNSAGGAIACDQISITVDGSSGPFLITSQNTATSWTAGNAESVTWSGSNTSMSPINASNVEILLSVDGGNTFPHTLVASTPNDGSESISVPFLTTSTGRIKVRPIGGNFIFFDINNIDIIITSSCLADGATFTPTTAVSETEGSTALDLTLTNSLGSVVTSFSGNLQAGDASSNLAFGDGTPASCAGSNSNLYEANTFYVDADGSYTITRSGSPFGQVTTLYLGSFNPSSVCSGWIASSATRPLGTGPVSLSSSVSGNLVVGQEYTLVNNIFSNNTSYYGTYTASFSGPGNAYDGPIAPAGFNYTYVIVDNATGNIVDFDAGTDLSDDNPGVYTLYGLSYDNTITLSTYVGSSFSSFLSDILDGTICASRSADEVSVTIEAALPVELISFTGVAKDHTNVLTWKTASEVNNDYFSLERSDDGGIFTEIGRVKGAGNSSKKVTYNYTDFAPIAGDNYYRLKQIDFDGRYEYSNILYLKNIEKEGFQIVPNPADKDIRVIFATSREAMAQIEIIDIQGKLIYKRDVEANEGNNSVLLDLGSIVSGAYILRLTTQNRVEISKFIVEK